MGGWTRTKLTAAVLVMLMCSCSTKKTGVSQEFQDTIERLRKNPGRAVAEGMDQQLVSSDGSRAHGAKMLQPGEPIWLQSGKSQILELKNPIKRVSIGDPELAGIIVLGPRTIMLNAKALPEKHNQNEQSLGLVSSKLISGYLGRTLTPEPHTAETSLVIWQENQGYEVHSLVVADFLDRQVLLEVTIAQIDRTAMEEHGIDVRAVQNDFIAAMFMGGGAGALSVVPGNPIFPLTLTPNRPNFAFVFPHEDVTALIQALQTEGLATVLAQPKLTAMSGQNAVFQVGGEIPIRIATGFAAQVEFKPFGVLVNFLPRISEEGDIQLTVTPEVSQPDFTQEVEGVPSFLVRRASTTTKLRNGETLILGGLLQKQILEEVRGVPYLMNIPILGYIFRQTTHASKITELMVVVTPRLIQPLPPGTQLTLPTDRGPLRDDDVRTQPDPAEASRPRIPGVP